MMQLLALLLSLVMIWAIGFLLVRLFAAKYCKEPVEQGAIALLLGLCIVGVAPILPLSLVGAGFAHILMLRWVVPILLFCLTLWFLRQSHSIRALQTHIKHSSLRSSSSFKNFSASAAMLTCGLFFFYASPPNEALAIALSGTTNGGQALLSVTTSSDIPQAFTLRITPDDRATSFFVPLAPINRASGPIQTILPLKGKLRCELFYTDSLSTASQPVRWIEIQLEEVVIGADP